MWDVLVSGLGYVCQWNVNMYVYMRISRNKKRRILTNVAVSGFYCFKMFRQIISTAESPLCYCLLVVFSQINCDFPGLWYDQWFSPVPWIFFNTMLGNSWPFKNISSRQLPSLGLACGFYWLFRLSWHPHCGNPGPVLLITVRCGKSHFSHPFSPSPSRSIPHGFRAV